MPVFRIFKNSDYTTMSNRHLRDKNLSLKAKGLQSMLLSLPEKWKFSVRGLAEICKEGKDGVTAVLKELEVNGYLVRHQERHPNGTMGSIEYWIYEIPQPPCPDSPCPEKPDAVEPDTATPDAVQPDTDLPEAATPPQIITNISNTEESKHERMEPPRHRYGQYDNVLLSDEELEKLKAEFPSDWQSRIELLSEYVASTGRRYKSHLATLRCWARRDKRRSVGYSRDKYQFREGESL